MKKPKHKQDSLKTFFRVCDKTSLMLKYHTIILVHIGYIYLQM